MMNEVVKKILLGIFLTGVVWGGELRVAGIFGEGAVLQRGVEVPVFGVGKAGEEVVVEFGGRRGVGRVDEKGKWRVELGELKADFVGRELVVVSGGERMVSRDVVVGDLWWCAGQSNMEWPMKNSPRFEEAKGRGEVRGLRQFKVKLPAAGEEMSAVGVKGEWAVCGEGTVGNFSAAGYHFGMEILRTVEVPVGLVNASLGASRIEAWMPEEVLKGFPVVGENWGKVLKTYPERLAEYEKKREAWKKAAAEKKARGEKVGNDWPRPPAGPGSREEPGGLWRRMVEPLVEVPVTGVLWYQAEGNTGAAGVYGRYFVAMIEGWRKAMGRVELPFFFVQLPNYNVPNDGGPGVMWAELREAQAEGLKLKGTGMVVSIDAGVATNGHPPDKLVVGERLARLAKVLVYGVEKGETMGAVAISARREGEWVVVGMSAKVEGKRQKEEVGLAGGVAGGTVELPVSEFGVVDEKGRVEVPEVVKIEGKEVWVRVGERKVVELRYAWRNAPVAVLFGAEGLPVAPFRVRVE